MRALALSVLLISVLASPAWCDGPVTTQPSAATEPAMPQGAEPGPLGGRTTDDQDGPGPAANPCGALDGRVHGQVDVGVGSDGYRHVGGYACKPLANGGWVAVGVSQSQSNGGGRR